ncbi:MAG: hypothetical protein ABI593_16630 [Betaproteobacteria bacterium]
MIAISGQARRCRSHAAACEPPSASPGGDEAVARQLPKLVLIAQVRALHRLPLPVIRDLTRQHAIELPASGELQCIDTGRIAAGLEARFPPFAIHLAADFGGTARVRLREQLFDLSVVRLGQPPVKLDVLLQWCLAVRQQRLAAEAGAGLGVTVLAGDIGSWRQSLLTSRRRGRPGVRFERRHALAPAYVNNGYRA